MNMRIVDTRMAPEAVGTYSQGMEYNGVTYFSGQIGLDPETMQLQESFEDQVYQILKNIDALLESQMLNRDHVIKTTIFLTDLKNFEKVNKAYSEYFREPYPARSCVQVSALPKGADVEIEVIAGK